MAPKSILITLILLFNILYIKGQISQPIFHYNKSSSLGIQGYIHTMISHIVSETLLNPYDTSLKIRKNILFFFKFNVDSIGKIENIHFSNGDPPSNYNSIKNIISDSDRTVKLNYLIDSAICHSGKHGYWIPAKNRNRTFDGPTMLVEVIYQPEVLPMNDSYFFVQNIDQLKNFFKSNEELIFLACIPINGGIEY
ncbi:MAG: hypothetical protein PW786_11965 [Arachidicoccus sp.]|nr:hypothetical protein [Arachidicoccus sp.]